MESPIYVLDRKVQQRISDNMSTSINSALDDTTPSDSGIQLLDSESSELMVESITSQAALEFDDSRSSGQEIKVLGEKLDNSHLLAVDSNNELQKEQMENSQFYTDSNSNVTENTPALDETMTSSNCSTFDTESIVYRRKVRKSQVSKPVPKKRVSFHEDILKNTRTDNIHIEHGFVTYKNGRKIIQKSGIPGRYSWCPDGENASKQADDKGPLCINQSEGDSDHGLLRRVVYRNACSDVLDYGNSDIFDANESMNYLHYSNSGVFEYDPQPTQRSSIAVEGNENGAHKVVKTNPQDQVMYKCSCSSSNSSLDSDENDKNCNRQQYGQAKSSSCDCIGTNQANNNSIIGDNCYFSEPNMENLNEVHKKSVWNKEKKPKSSCLKKTKRHTNIIQEQDLNTKVKKFNVHNMNQLLDNSSKMIFGSLKSIFTIPLPERGVPEGSEDLQSVIECIPDQDQTPDHHQIQHNHHKNNKQWTTSSPISPTNLKAKPFLSKSLDGSNNPAKQQSSKNFVHNVDEQLRRKNENEIYASTRQNSEQEQVAVNADKRHEESEKIVANENNPFTNCDDDATASEMKRHFRNKFIINCESTVFEHTGVSYCYDDSSLDNGHENGFEMNSANIIDKETLIAQAEYDNGMGRGTFITVPIKKTFSNFFRSFKESAISPTGAKAKNIANNITDYSKNKDMQKTEEDLRNHICAKTDKESTKITKTTIPKNMSTSTSSSSTMSEQTTTTTATSSSNSIPKSMTYSASHSTPLDKQSRHLPSPLKKRQLTGGSANAAQLTVALPPRYESHNSSRMSPDLFNIYTGTRGGSGRDSKSTILSEEFDDILTITTDNEKSESDIVMIDYPELIDRNSSVDYANLLKPPQAKASLINRFLRNVTQKKILETSIRKNNFFANKLKSEHKLFTNSLYVPGAKPQNFELIDDLNAEIAMEIEMSGANSPRRELVNIDSDLQDDTSRFELGIGEISIDIFNGNHLSILHDATEQLMKVFKLYTGYSKEGFMTPVLVLLTDKTLYVTDLVRNRLCSKFVLAYNELDVILLGHYGNTVLLSNSTRNKQQILLAGGPYQADSLVANLELCARRSGCVLPAVGQLTLGHLKPLQAFVRENSCVTKADCWVYYAVVHVPSTGTIGTEQEPLGPHIKGFLMHRRVKDHSSNSSHSKSHWSPGYFLLKAGVLYMFNDSSRRLPSWAVALAECQGARRSVRTGRPHCFEIVLKDGLLQLAAPDEYVASEWLQALLQSASGLFEMQEKHKSLGCTLVMTNHHLLTLREDFSAPLRVVNNESGHTLKQETCLLNEQIENKLIEDNQSLLSSTLSTPTKGGGGTVRSCSSINSTPTKLSQLSRSSAATFNNSASTNASFATATATSTIPNALHCGIKCTKDSKGEKKRNFPGMSSVYGENSGLEILTCADIKEMTGIKIPSHTDTWWCILEFSYQEVRECSDDLVIFFASSSEMQRFLRLLEELWQAKNNDLFPIMVLDEDDIIAEQCTILYMDINRSWEPLLSAALGYPL